MTSQWRNRDPRGPYEISTIGGHTLSPHQIIKNRFSLENL